MDHGSAGGEAAAHHLFPATAASFLEEFPDGGADAFRAADGPGLASSQSAAAASYDAATIGESMMLGASESSLSLAPARTAAPLSAVDAAVAAAAATASSIPSQQQLQPFEDVILEYMFRRATRTVDPFTAQGVEWPAGVTQRRQFLLTHFVSLARRLIYIGLDPASRRFLDFHRSPVLEAFLRSTYEALGPTPAPEAMLQHVASHAPEEIRGLLSRVVPAGEFLLVEPAPAGAGEPSMSRPRRCVLRLHKCACLNDKLESGLEVRVEGLDGLHATLDDLYDGLERHLLLNPSSLLMPRGVEPVLVIRYNQPDPGKAPIELLLAREQDSMRPYRWRASLSPSTVGIAQHIFDPSREGVNTRLRDLGVLLPTTEVHACLSDGKTHGACVRTYVFVRCACYCNENYHRNADQLNASMCT